MTTITVTRPPAIHPPFFPQDILSSLIPTLYLEDAPHSSRIRERPPLIRAASRKISIVPTRIVLRDAAIPLPLFRPEETKEKRKKRKEERRKIPPISECSQSTAACRNLTEDYRRRGNVRRLKKQPRVACRSLRGCDVISIRVVFLHGLAEGRRGWKRY